MKTPVRVLASRAALFALFATGVGHATLAAAGDSTMTRSIADGPDPREIPLPAIKTSFPDMPGVSALPERKEMPDVLTMNDGTKVTTPAQWAKRREEMKAILSYYAIGHMPPPPGNVKGHEVKSETVANGKAQYRLVHLTFGPDEKLNLDVGLLTPAEGGPFPVVITPIMSIPGAIPLPKLPPGPNQGKNQNVLILVGPDPTDAPAPAAKGEGAALFPGQEGSRANAATRGGRSGGPATAESLAERYKEQLQRGYALAFFNVNDCAEDTTLRKKDGSWAFRSTRFPAAYPDYDWGILAAWAWGASRIADYLVTDSVFDKTKMIITGASRAGKSALIAAAFDDRLLGAPVVTGGGGIPAYRFSGINRGGKEGLGEMMNKYPNWFSPHLHQFWTHADQLPFDNHWYVALCAPRPFVALEGNTDQVSLASAVKKSFLAAQPAYAFLGAKDKLGIHYSNHGHAFTDEDWTALMDFEDHHVMGKPAKQPFDQFLPEPTPETTAK